MDYLVTNRDTILKNPKYRRLSPDFKAMYQVAYNSCDSAGFLDIDMEYLCFHANVKDEPSEDEFFNAMEGFVERVSSDVLIVVNFVTFAKVGTKDAITPWADFHRCIFTEAVERQSQGLKDAYKVIMKYNPTVKIKSLKDGERFLEPIKEDGGSERHHKTKKAYERAVHAFAELGIPYEGTANYTLDEQENKLSIDKPAEETVKDATENEEEVTSKQVTLEDIDIPDQSKPLQDVPQVQHDKLINDDGYVMNRDGTYFNPTNELGLLAAYKRYPKEKLFANF